MIFLDFIDIIACLNAIIPHGNEEFLLFSRHAHSISFIVYFRFIYLCVRYFSLYKQNGLQNPTFWKCGVLSLECEVSFSFFISLCVNNSAVKAQPRTLRVLKMHSHFWLTLTACLFFCRHFVPLFLCYFYSALLFSCDFVSISLFYFFLLCKECSCHCKAYLRCSLARLHSLKLD